MGMMPKRGNRPSALMVAECFAGLPLDGRPGIKLEGAKTLGLRQVGHELDGLLIAEGQELDLCALASLRFVGWSLGHFRSQLSSFSFPPHDSWHLTPDILLLAQVAPVLWQPK
jgi:hypothetical protein